MTNNKHLPVYPCRLYLDGKGWHDHAGISERTLIAAMCLQGLLANPEYNNPRLKHNMVTVSDTAKTALNYADALFTHLQNTEK